MTTLRTWIDAQGRGAIKRLQASTGIPLRSLYRYIDGTRMPPLDHAVALTRETGVAIESLIKPAATVEHAAE